MRRTLALFVLFVAGCEFVPGPTPLDLTGERIMVHSILRAGVDTVSVLLTRVDPADDARMVDETVDRLSGAEVRMVAGGDTVRLPEAPSGFRACYRTPGGPADADTVDAAGPGCHAAVLPGGVVAGGRYGLSIRLPDGDTVRGEAVVPHAPALLVPGSGARFRLRRVEADPENESVRFGVRWRPPESRAVVFELDAADVFRAGERRPDAQCSISRYTEPRVRFRQPISDVDSLAVVIRAIMCSEPDGAGHHRSIEDWDSVDARIRITAYDTAYTRYVRDVFFGGQTIRDDRASAGLKGAAGVFGGAASAERRIRFLAPER